MPMPNIAVVLKEEIARIARREIRDELAQLRKASTSHRSEIAELKRRIKELEQTVRRLERPSRPSPVEAAKDTSNESLRFSAKGLATHRSKLGLSAADYGKLAGASGQSIYKWEEGARPRAKQLAGLAAVRKLGKREALARLEAMQ